MMKRVAKHSLFKTEAVLSDVVIMRQLPGTTASDPQPCGALMAIESFWDHCSKSSHRPLAVLNGLVLHGRQAQS